MGRAAAPEGPLGHGHQPAGGNPSCCCQGAARMQFCTLSKTIHDCGIHSFIHSFVRCESFMGPTRTNMHLLDAVCACPGRCVSTLPILYSMPSNQAVSSATQLCRSRLCTCRSIVCVSEASCCACSLIHPSVYVSRAGCVRAGQV